MLEGRGCELGGKSLGKEEKVKCEVGVFCRITL